MSRKDYARALLEFRNASSVMPRDAEPHYRMGLAYLDSGDAASSFRAFQRATALNPDHSGAQLKIAEFLTMSRDEKLVQQAVDRLLGAFGTSPDNPEAIDTLAIAEWKLGRPEDALERLEQAVQKFPTHLQSAVTLARMKVNQNDAAGAEQVLKKALADAPQSSSAALALGELYVFMRQPSKAEVEVRRALQLDSKSDAALKALAAIQISQKRTDEAEQTLKALASLPGKAYKPVHAIFLFQIGKKDAALAEFESLARSDPEDRAARSRLVDAYLAMGRIPQAESVLEAALKRNAKDTEALTQRAAVRIQAGKADDAETDLKQVLRFTPDSASAHHLLAEVYRAKGLQNNQQQELEETLRLNPGMLRARATLAANLLSANQPKAALAVIDAAPEAQKTQVAWMISRNWALLAIGNLAEAKTGVDRALERGRPPDAIYQSAVLRLLHRDSPGAQSLLEELLKSGVTDTRVLQLMMQSYAEQKALAKGLTRLREVAVAQPASAPLQYLLGQWESRSGNAVEAQKAFESAKAADSHFLAADLSLAEIDVQSARYDAARQRLGSVIGANPKNIPALLLSARAEDAAGDRSTAISRYRAVLSLDGSNLIGLNNLAYLLAQENPDEALKLAQQAAELAPDSPNVQDTLGWIYYRRGLYSMAVRHLKTAVDKEATPRRQFHLGMSYLKIGDHANGQRIVAEALTKDPNLAKTEQGW